MRPIDTTDCIILGALQADGRLSNKELAAKAGIAQSTCLERVRRLLEEKVLRGFHAEVDPRSMGVGLMAMVAVRLTRHSRDLVDTFREHVMGLQEVVAIYHMAGANDFLLHVAVRDADHLRDLALSALTTRPEVAQIETALIFEHVGSRALPCYATLGDELG